MTNTQPCKDSEPIGLIPKYVWEKFIIRDRKKEILDAIERYACSGYGIKIPEEWFKELRDLF